MSNIAILLTIAITEANLALGLVLGVIIFDRRK